MRSEVQSNQLNMMINDETFRKANMRSPAKDSEGGFLEIKCDNRFMIH